MNVALYENYHRFMNTWAPLVYLGLGVLFLAPIAIILWRDVLREREREIKSPNGTKFGESVFGIPIVRDPLCPPGQAYLRTHDDGSQTIRSANDIEWWAEKIKAHGPLIPEDMPTPDVTITAIRDLQRLGEKRAQARFLDTYPNWGSE